MKELGAEFWHFEEAAAQIWRFAFSFVGFVINRNRGFGDGGDGYLLLPASPISCPSSGESESVEEQTIPKSPNFLLLIFNGVWNPDTGNENCRAWTILKTQKQLRVGLGFKQKGFNLELCWSFKKRLSLSSSISWLGKALCVVTPQFSPSESKQTPSKISE